MAASVGLPMNPPHAAEERAVFAQLKPVRMSGADGAEDASVFEDVKPGVRGAAGPQLRPFARKPPISSGLQPYCRGGKREKPQWNTCEGSQAG